MAAIGRRGPKRSEETRLAILKATAQRVTEVGYDHLTIEGVAAAAGVSKQTIYRWWSSRSALVADCLAEKMLLSDLLAPQDSGDLRSDLIQWLEDIVGFLRSSANTGLLSSLIVASADNPDVATRLSERLGLHELLGERFSNAVDAGELSPNVPTAEFGDALLGALVLRDLRGGDLDNGFAQRLTDLLLPSR